MDDSIVYAYYKEVRDSSYSHGQGGYIFPCSATLQFFTVGIGSYKAVILGT